MPMQLQKEGRGIDRNHLQPDARRRLVVSTMLRPLYPWQRPGNHYQGGMVGLSAALDSMENLSPPGFDLQTIQLIGSCYANYTTPSRGSELYILEFT